MPTRKLVLAAITLLILGILVSRLDAEQTLDILRRADLGILALCALISLLFPVLCAMRWHWLMQELDAPIRFRDSLVIVLAAWPLGAITPAKSGDLIKIVFLKDVMSYTRTTGIILAERLLDVGVLSASALVGGLVLGTPLIAVAGGGILLGMAFFFVLASSSLHTRLPERYAILVQDVFRSSLTLYASPRTFGLCLAVTVLNWFLTYVQTWLCFIALDSPVSLAYTCTALPIAIFVGLLPVTMAGMGTRDGAMIALFQPMASYEAVVTVGILYSIFGYWWLTLIGFPFLRMALSGNIERINPDRLKMS